MEKVCASEFALETRGELIDQIFDASIITIIHNSIDFFSETQAEVADLPSFPAKFCQNSKFINQKFISFWNALNLH